MAIGKVFNADEYADGVWSSSLKVMLGEIAGPASYPTNGFTADVPTDFEVALAKIKGAVVQSDAGYPASFNADYNKIKVYASAGTEVTNTTDLSGLTFTITLFISDE